MTFYVYLRVNLEEFQRYSKNNSSSCPLVGERDLIDLLKAKLATRVIM